MTKKTISQQSDGDSIRKPTADKIFEQDGATHKFTEASKTFHIKSLTHLENLFPNLEIPDGDKVTLIFDESFALSTEGFKIGLDSHLEILRSSIDTEIDVTALTEPLFSNLNPANDINSLIVGGGIRFVGNGTQPFCILNGTLRCFMLNCVPIGFAGAETEFPFYEFDTFPPSDWTKGWIIKNPSIVQITITNLRQLTDEGLTFFSFILGNAASIIINNNSESTLFAGESLLFFDPNAPTGTDIRINGTSISGGDFYQQGFDFPITSVTDNGGIAVFNSDPFILHGLAVGDKITLSGFTNSEYNNEFFVTVVGSTTSFEVGEAFVGNDSGIIENSIINIVDVINNGGQADFETSMPHGLVVGKVVTFSDLVQYPNETFIVTSITSTTRFQVGLSFNTGDTGFITTRSLDQTSGIVTATNNKNERDSMLIGEIALEIFGSEISTVSLSQNQVSEIFGFSNQWEFSNLERFEVFDIIIGSLQAKDTSTREYNVSYSATIEKSGGGSTNIGIVLFKNGDTLNEVSFKPPHTVNSGKIQITGSDLVELGEDERLAIGVKNYESTSAVILISQAKLVISKT